MMKDNGASTETAWHGVDVWIYQSEANEKKKDKFLNDQFPNQRRPAKLLSIRKTVSSPKIGGTWTFFFGTSPTAAYNPLPPPLAPGPQSTHQRPYHIPTPFTSTRFLTRASERASETKRQRERGREGGRARRTKL